MISWNDCDVRIGDHGSRIARAERVGRLTSFPEPGQRPRAGAATVVAWMQQRVDAILALAGRRLPDSGQAVGAG